MKEEDRKTFKLTFKDQRRIINKEITLLDLVVEKQEEIEILQKRTKELEEGFKASTEELCDYATENERLHSIIKEVRELINKALNVNSDYVNYEMGTELLRQELLEILDKENK